MIWALQERIERVVLVHQNALPVAVEIVELTIPRRPEQDGDGGDSKNQHAGYQTVNYLHEIVSIRQFPVFV